MTECGMSGVRWILGCFTAKGGSILQYDAEREIWRIFVSLQLYIFVLFGRGPAAVSNF